MCFVFHAVEPQLILFACDVSFSSAEMDVESKAAYGNEDGDVPGCGSREMVENSETNISKNSSDVNVDGIDVHLEAVDVAVGDSCHAAAGTTAEFETQGRTMSLSASSNKRHKCKHCNKTFNSLAVLHEHYLTSHGGEDFTIPMKPPISVSDKIQLRLSRRSLAMKHPSCWVCGRVCSSLAVLKQHFVLKHSAEDQNILSNDKLLRSKAFVHPVNGLQSDKKYGRSGLLCDLCGKVCRNSREFYEHSVVHGGAVIEQEGKDADVQNDDGGRKYVCEMCGKVCLRPSALASHRRFHIRDQAHSCMHCGKMFTMKKNLERHQRQHTGERQLICEHCGRSFMHRASLRDHKSRQHHDKVATEIDSLSFRCKRCGERFSQISLLRQHIVELHRPVAPKERSLCTLCGKSFSCKFTLSMHMRLHTGERPHGCSQCDRSFPTRAALRQHAFHHTNSYPHVCSTCGKCFTVPSALANHERVHSGVKPFSCEHCGRMFGQRYHLKQHVLSMHSKDKLLHCSECDAAFSRQLDLKRHSLCFHQTAEFITQPL